MGSLEAKIKIAVIGVGLIGPRHAQTVIDDPNAILSAIVDPVPRGADFAAQLGVSHYSSIGELLSSPDRPDGAIICTPNHTHVPVGLELIAGGVHILVEKPVCTDLASGAELLKAAAKAGVKVLVGHHRRFNPYVVAAKQAISSGSLGDIVALNGLWTTYKPADYFAAPAEWRQTTTGGVIFINMIHEIDILHEFFGPITRVYAEKAPSRRGFEAEEGAAVTLRFSSGAVGTFLISDNTPSPHNFEAGTGENPLIPQAGEDFYRIFGSNATLSVPDLTRWSYDDKAKKSWHETMTKETRGVVQETPFKLQLAHFLGVIQGREEPKCSGEAGMAALAVCEALKRSLNEEIPVVVEKISVGF